MKNLILGFALAMPVLEAVAAPRSFAERLKDDQPFFIAHRGIIDNTNGVKENTLALFEAAGRAKMQAIETDVRLAADGALVCSHDASLKRVFGIDLNVEKVMLAEVRKHPVPTFAEYLDVCAKYDAVPFVETKGDKKVVAPVLDELRQRGLLKVAVISSSSIDHIREARRLDKEVFVHHIFSKPALLDEIAAMGNAGLSWNYPDLRKLPPELVEKAHAKGIKCCLRGCDSPEAFREMRRLKLDYLPTNRMTPAKVRVFLDLMRTEEGRDADGAKQPCTLEFVVDQVDESGAITAWGGMDPVKLPSGEEYRELCKRMNKSGELPENVSIVRAQEYKG